MGTSRVRTQAGPTFSLRDLSAIVCRAVVVTEILAPKVVVCFPEGAMPRMPRMPEGGERHVLDALRSSWDGSFLPLPSGPAWCPSSSRTPSGPARVFWRSAAVHGTGSGATAKA